MSLASDVTDAATQLRRAVAIGEEARILGEESRMVSRLSLNAIVLARRSGDAALGFAEVSHHMSGQSRQIDEGTRALWTQTAAWVRRASSLLQRARVARTLERAITAARAAGAEANAPVAIDEQLRAAAGDELRAARGVLAEHLEELGRSSMVGLVLSRAARIEACYGGEHRAALSQLSGEFAERAGHIHETIKTMRLLIENGVES